jgi:type I site-specific restriction-modification system R (restriction) subunit
MGGGRESYKWKIAFQNWRISLWQATTILPQSRCRKLLNGKIHSQSQRNVVQSKAFSERLETAIARYHANAITTVQVLEELIQIAKDIRAARARGEETGLSDQEIAFYDALAENQSARDIMGEPALRLIAHELMNSIKENVSATGCTAKPPAPASVCW